jgi:hypothetical protein
MDYWSQILSFLGGLVGGWVLKIYVDRRSYNASQNLNRVGGDMAGRDINKK